jgi:hypothetical protein
MTSRKQRMSYIFLCLTPFIACIAVLLRPLRIPGVYHVIGVVLFAAICTAAWNLGARVISDESQSRRLLALAGTLLVTPFALIALFWVGLGSPEMATAAENQMRYLVLILMTLGSVGGFVALREALSESNERFYSTLGYTAIMLSGPAYLIWHPFAFGAYYGKEHGGVMPPAIVSLGPFANTLVSLAAGITYSATAAFAASLARAGWLGRKASLTYIIVNFIAILLIIIMVAVHPDPKGASLPWYTLPGLVFIVPALPLIMPSLMGAMLLRRAGQDQPKLTSGT